MYILFLMNILIKHQATNIYLNTIKKNLIHKEHVNLNFTARNRGECKYYFKRMLYYHLSV